MWKQCKAATLRQSQGLKEIGRIQVPFKVQHTVQQLFVLPMQIPAGGECDLEMLTS